MAERFIVLEDPDKMISFRAPLPVRRPTEENFIEWNTNSPESTVSIPVQPSANTQATSDVPLSQTGVMEVANPESESILSKVFNLFTPSPTQNSAQQASAPTDNTGFTGFLDKMSSQTYNDPASRVDNPSLGERLGFALNNIGQWANQQPFMHQYSTDTGWGQAMERLNRNKLVNSQLQVQQMNAIAAQMNAMKNSRAMSTWGKTYNDVYNVTKDSNLARLMADESVRNGGVNVNLGERQSKREELLDNMLVDQVKEFSSSASAAGNVISQGDVLLKLFEENPNLLNYSGRLFAEQLYTLGRQLGITESSTDEAIQMLSNFGNAYRQLFGRKTVGGGQISNYEQEIINMSIPGLDKTGAQNLVAVKAAVGLAKITQGVSQLMVKGIENGLSVSDVGKMVDDYRAVESKKLYEELIKGQKVPKVSLKEGDIVNTPRGRVRIDANGNGVPI